MARVRALAPNYFKYKMITKQPFIFATRDDGMSGEIPSLGRSLGPSLGPSGHVDDFTRRNLPPFDQWPQLLLDRPEFSYPEYLNVAVELTDRIVEQGLGDRIALIGNGDR